MSLNPDKYLLMLGRYSRWQLFVYSFLSLTIWVPTCWQMLTVVFIATVPKYHCIQSDNDTRPADRCMQAEGNTSEPCTNGFWHDPEINSIHTEWDLYCEREPFGFSISQMVFQIALLSGILVTSPLSDRFGRKKVHLCSLVCMCVVGFLTAFSPNVWLFIVGRALTGLVREGVAYAGVVAASELFPTAQRSFAGTAHEIAWGVGMISLAVIAYFVRNWRHLQMTLSLVPFIFVIYFWLLPESICWLLANGRRTEAKNILIKALKFNKMPIPDEINNLDSDDVTLAEETEKSNSATVANHNDNTASETPDSSYGLRDMFRSKVMLRNTVVMCFIWFVTTMVYYGLSLSTGTLGGNRYVNFLLSGLSEIIGFMVIIIVMPHIGRKKPMIVSSTCSGLCLATITLLPKEWTDSSPWFEIILSNLGKVFITSNFAVIIAYVPELYPTNLRSVGVSFSVVSGRLGSLLSPYYYLVAKEIPWLPMAVSSLLAFCCAAVTCILPETLTRPLPMSIAEIESWTKDKPTPKADAVENDYHGTIT